jgi:hypothetical protein
VQRGRNLHIISTQLTPECYPILDGAIRIRIAYFSRRKLLQGRVKIPIFMYCGSNCLIVMTLLYGKLFTVSSHEAKPFGWKTPDAYLYFVPPTR